MLKPISNLSILCTNKVPSDFYDNYSMSSKRKQIAQFMQNSIEQLENLENDLELMDKSK